MSNNKCLYKNKTSFIKQVLRICLFISTFFFFDVSFASKKDTIFANKRDIIFENKKDSIPESKKDSIYIEPYPHKWWIKAFIPTKILIIKNGNDIFHPNFPLSLGAGVGLRKIIGINILVSFSFLHLKNDTGLSSSITDFQMHKYGKKLLLDGYYQDYKGFYSQKDKDNYTLFPELSVKRWGLDGTYVKNNKKFSLRAAFEQSEKQVKSAGSLLLGGGIYYHKITPDATQEQNIPNAFENYQMGFNAGYAYSWVISPRWLLSGMISVGPNFGNNSEAFAWRHLKIYPASIGRFTFNYNEEDWSLALTGIFNNKSVYSPNPKTFYLFAPTLQLTFTRHIK